MWTLFQAYLTTRLTAGNAMCKCVAQYVGTLRNVQSRAVNAFES